MTEVEEGYAAAPASGVGVPLLGQLFIFLCVCGGIARAQVVVESRRKVSLEAWLADQRNYELYLGWACISVCQCGLAVLRIFDGAAFISGVVDLANAIIGCYLSDRPMSFAKSTLPAYLLFSGFTSAVDTGMLLWDLEHWNGSWGDVARPCLCFASIYVAYTFLNGIRQHSGKGTGLADRLLDMMLASSLVQQASLVIGMVEIDPLLSGSPEVAGISQIMSETSEHDVPCEVPDALAPSSQEVQEETHRNAGVLSGGLDTEVNDMLTRYSSMLDSEPVSEPQEFETPLHQGMDPTSGDLSHLVASSEAPLQGSLDDLQSARVCQSLVEMSSIMNEVPEFASDVLDDDLF